MAIDLPPGTAPALASTTEIRQFSESALNTDAYSIETRIAGYKVLVFGNTLLSAEAVQNALKKGGDLSEAVWHLHYAYQAAGHRLTRLRYLLDGTELYIQVLEGEIREIVGPKSLTRYFWDVDGKQFDLPTLESRRILANLQAKREGLLTQAYYDPIQPASKDIRLSIDSQRDPDFKALSYHAEIGNPGNRFVGRHFGFFDLKLDSRHGQWKAAVNKSLNGLDKDSDRGGHYQGYQLAFNSVTPIGLLGIGLGKSDYDFLSAGRAFDAELRQAQLLLQEILHADQQSRTILSQRIFYTNSSSKTADTDQLVLDERYFAVEAGIEYSRRFQQTPLKPLLKISGNLRKGLSDKNGSFEPPGNGLKRDPRFSIFLPSLEVELLPWQDWKIAALLSSQYADRSVPEQQQWVLGGPKRIRAKLPGTLFGDGGHYLGLELFPPVTVLGSILKMQTSVFVEAGSSRLQKNNSASGYSKSQRVYDAGLSLEFAIAEQWTLNISKAESFSEALSPRTEQIDDAEFYFSLQGNWQ